MANLASEEIAIRVLHVDDDSDFLEISKEILMTIGTFEIDNALCVKDAFKKLANGKQYDVVVSDYEMPQKSGLDFLLELRQQKNAIPFVLFTGKGREEVAIKALNLGADGYYNKQGSPETVYGELSHGIQLAVARKQAEENARKNEQKRLEQLVMLSDFSSKLNLSESLDEVCVLVCKKIKEIVGQGYVVVTLMDETEQKLTIRATEGFNDSGMVNSAIRLLGGDPRGTEYYTKDMFPEELEQFRSGKLELINDGLYVIMTRKHPKVACKMLERLMGIHFVYTIGFIHKNRHLGGAIVMLKTQEAVQENKALIETVMGQSSPIIGRGWSELKLHESELKFRTIADSSFDWVYWLSPADGFVYVSPSCERITGYTSEEFTRNPQLLHQIVNPQYAKLVDSHFDLFSSKDNHNLEFQIKSKSGETRWISHVCQPVFDDNGTWLGRRATNRDVTERKKAEKVLLASEERYRELYEQAPFGYQSLDAEGRFITVNQAWLNLLGYSREEVVGHWFGDFLVPTQAELFRKRFAIFKAAGKIHSEFEIKRKDGTIASIAFDGKISYNLNGEFKQTHCSLQDITKRKKSEEKLKNNYSKLGVMNEKLHVVGSLTRHDVSNKLTVIQNNAYLLKKQISDKPELTKYFDSIDAAIASSQRLFEFSRLYEKIGIEELSKIEVYESFNHATTMAPNLGKIKVVNNSKGLSVNADSLLVQLFYNLIDNSLRHGEKVTQIRLSYTKSKNEVELFYEDDGVGIPAANRSKIFEEGFSTSKSTGLGLHLIKKIVEVYGWSITEQGKEGKGAKFVIAIPNTATK